jgi:hypothetical protein
MKLPVVIACFLGVHAVLYHLGRTWGSTSAERTQALPGDDIVPDASWIMDHGITIKAPVERVWPWLVQVGWGRAGWYTYRWVDQLLFPRNAPSASEILPQQQSLKVGDKILDGPPDAGCFFVVDRMEPGRFIVLHSTTHLPPQLLNRPDVNLNWTWTLALDPTIGNNARFHLRVRGTIRPLWLQVLAHLLVVPADFLMGRSMCKGLKHRVEAYPGV